MSRSNAEVMRDLQGALDNLVGAATEAEITARQLLVAKLGNSALLVEIAQGLGIQTPKTPEELNEEAAAQAGLAIAETVEYLESDGFGRIQKRDDEERRQRTWGGV